MHGPPSPHLNLPIPLQCSYSPRGSCSTTSIELTEPYFRRLGALKPGAKYPCFYSPEVPHTVVLQRFLTVPIPVFVLGAIFVAVGVVTWALVKFRGRRCGCPAQSDIIAAQREEMEELQLQARGGAAN